MTPPVPPEPAPAPAPAPAPEPAPAPRPELAFVPPSPAPEVHRKTVDLVPILLVVVVAYLVWRATRPQPAPVAPVAS